jgi:hypothetical protein
MDKKPIGAYRAENKTGWAAYDKDGRTWPVEEDQAQKLEADRRNRNSQAGKPET